MTSNDTVKPDQAEVTPQRDSVAEAKTRQVSIASTASSSTLPLMLTTRVSFNQIEIREYSRCMGDNPATTEGPPLSIDWDYNVAGTYAVDEYECVRTPQRLCQTLCVPRTIREDILLTQTDVTKTEMKKAVEEIRVARFRRSMSVASRELDGWHRVRECVARRFRRLQTGISKKREQELLWENAQRVLAAKSADSKSKTIMKNAEDPPSDDGSALDPEDITRQSSSSTFVGIEDVESF